MAKTKAASKKPVPGTPGDPTDHSKPATAIAAQVDPKGTSGATINAKSTAATAVSREDQAAKDKKSMEEDQSIAGKILRSGLYFVRDHSTGEDYVGISPQNNPDSSEASKLRSAVTPLGVVAPRTGMVVRPKDGPAFTIGEGFGPGSNPGDWARVTNPDGKPLFA